MAESKMRTLLIATIIAAAAGMIGGGAILFFEQQGPLRPAPFYALPSILTWIVLHRFVRNRSIIRAVIIGLLSPLAACIIFLPLYAVPLIWALFLARYWWITLPIAIGTSLLIQLCISDYENASASWRRLAALAFLVLAVGVGAAPYVVRGNRDPLRADVPGIRARLLSAVPPGSSPDAVIGALGKAIAYDRGATGEFFGEPQYQPRIPARRMDRGISYPVGKGSVQAVLGWYYSSNGRVNVFSQWAFDDRDRLIDVYVEKLDLRGAPPDSSK
jgi:hypothetical protein